jgi:type IV secretion system protein VirB6
MTTFFEDLGTPLLDQCASLANSVATSLSAAVTPLFLGATTVSIFFYGLAVMRGESGEGAMTFVWRIFKVALILCIVQAYVSLGIIDLASTTQDDFVSVVAGGSNALQVIDNATVPYLAFTAGAVIFGMSVASDNYSGIFMALLVLCFVILGGGVLALALFYALLAKVGLYVVLALGPLFIAALAFGPTLRFFELWLSSLLNFSILSGVSAMMLTLVTTSQKAAFLSVFTNPLNGLVMLILFGVVLLLFMMEVPRLVMALTNGADVTNGLTAYAINRAVYSPPWLSSVTPAGSSAALKNGVAAPAARQGAPR